MMQLLIASKPLIELAEADKAQNFQAARLINLLSANGDSSYAALTAH